MNLVLSLFNHFRVFFQQKYVLTFFVCIIGYHEELLHSMCIFRRSTVEAVKTLANMEDPYQALNQTVFENERAVTGEEQLRLWQPPKVAERFKERVNAVATWIAECKSRSGS